MQGSSKLFIQAITKFLAGLLLVSILVFLPAGTLAYWQAWLLIGILFIPMFIAGLVMMKKSPDLLRKRLNAKEEQDEQKTVILLSGLMFLAAFVLAGLNFRFGWIVLPGWVSYAAAAVFLAAYALYAEVLRENVYLSSTVGHAASLSFHAVGVGIANLFFDHAVVCSDHRKANPK